MPKLLFLSHPYGGVTHGHEKEVDIQSDGAVGENREKHSLNTRAEVMLDSELAELYDVETKALTRAVRRNIDRFPADFMFQLR